MTSNSKQIEINNSLKNKDEVRPGKQRLGHSTYSESFIKFEKSENLEDTGIPNSLIQKSGSILKILDFSHRFGRSKLI
jgi:hypothetical protein